jgi:chaperonin cofactor prefoldin
VDKLIITTPTETDPFWEGVVLPHQAEDSEVSFTNPVVTAEWFAEKTSTISELGGQAEAIEEEVANLKIHLRRAESSLSKLKRRILAASYEKITKSADRTIQDAFVIRQAKELGWEEEFNNIEDMLEEIRREIEIREPARDRLYLRLKTLKDSQESARHYLDFEKLEMRNKLQNEGRGYAGR